MKIGFVTILILSLAAYLLNPERRLADERNKIRYENITMVINGITEYASKNSGSIPSTIPVSDNCYDKKHEICRASANDCKGKVNLTSLVTEKYLDLMPVDPNEESKNGTGYNIVRSESGIITLCSPHSELGRTVEYIR